MSLNVIISAFWMTFKRLCIFMHCCMHKYWKQLSTFSQKSIIHNYYPNTKAPSANPTCVPNTKAPSNKPTRVPGVPNTKAPSAKPTRLPTNSCPIVPCTKTSGTRKWVISASGGNDCDTVCSAFTNNAGAGSTCSPGAAGSGFEW